jgi:branched-chain amino acid transport system permease protein
MVTGLIFVVCVLAFRRGIMGEIEARRRARSQRQAAAPVPSRPVHAAQAGASGHGQG